MLCLVSLVSVECVLKLWISSCRLALLVLRGGTKPNLCGNVLSMPLFGASSWSITLAFLMASIQTSKSYGIG